eukprot:Pgem_evm1s8007
MCVYQDLQESRKYALDQIYRKVNESQTAMGVEKTSGGKDEKGIIYIDFHGLHIEDVKHKIDDVVVPVLPHVEAIVIVTGKGSHSTE